MRFERGFLATNFELAAKGQKLRDFQLIFALFGAHVQEF